MSELSDVQLKSMLVQRRVLAILCALLVPLCIGFGILGHETNLPYWYNSISSTYFANSNVMMIGLLFATGVFFFSYRGYNIWDRILSIIQGVACFGIVLFPCETVGLPERIGLFNIPVKISSVIHYSFAGMLFTAFGVNIMFMFTKHGETMTEKKKLRNKIYYTCASLIFLGVLLQLLFAIGILGFLRYWIPFTLVNEFVMLVAFAVAYWVKSDSIKSLRD